MENKYIWLMIFEELCATGKAFFQIYNFSTTRVNVSFQVERTHETILSCPSKAKLNLPRNDHGFLVFASSAMVWYGILAPFPNVSLIPTLLYLGLNFL